MRELLAVLWVAGIVLAKGFWLTVLAVCFPLYAWYLIVEKIMIIAGLINA
ncbi:MAG TPA: hypothetical protein VFM18_07305 [Methanosarcina sp.]|nr:hypothetical protein [Methanosarcina sp.]